MELVTKIKTVDSNNIHNKIIKVGSSPISIIIQALFLIILTLGIIYIVFLGENKHDIIDLNDKSYYAVILNNEKIYFGNIEKISGKVVSMINVFSPGEINNSEDQNVVLVKSTNQFYQPNGKVVFPMQQILTIEELQKNSRIAKVINEQK